MFNTKALCNLETISIDCTIVRIVKQVTIYLYVASQTYKRWEKGEVPADIVVEPIRDYQMGELKKLKTWIYRQLIKARIKKKECGIDRHRKKQKYKRKLNGQCFLSFKFDI